MVVAGERRLFNTVSLKYSGGKLGSKMSSLTKQEQLSQLIDEQQERIRQTFPAQRGSAVVALTRARDWHSLKLQDTLNAATKTAPAHHSYLYYSGWQKALQVCFGNVAE